MAKVENKNRPRTPRHQKLGCCKALQKQGGRRLQAYIYIWGFRIFGGSPRFRGYKSFKVFGWRIGGFRGYWLRAAGFTELRVLEFRALGVWLGCWGWA